MAQLKNKFTRSRIGVWAASAATLTLVLTGCSQGGDDGSQAQQGTSNDNPASAGPSAPASSSKQGQQMPDVSKAGVKWMGEFCDGMSQVTTAAQKVPQPDSKKPADLKDTMSKTLASIMSGDKEFLAALDDMDSSPIKGGDKLVSAAKDSYGDLYDNAKKAKSELDESSISNTKDLKKQMKSAQQRIQKADLQAPLKQLQSHKKLMGAFQQASECRDLVKSAQQQQQQQVPQQQGQQGPQSGGGAPAPLPGN